MEILRPYIFDNNSINAYKIMINKSNKCVICAYNFIFHVIEWSTLIIIIQKLGFYTFFHEKAKKNV